MSIETAVSLQARSPTRCSASRSAGCSGLDARGLGVAALLGLGLGGVEL
jgi:hypothetical protein